MHPEIGKQGTFLTEGGGLGESVEAEVATLEFALTKVAPLGEGDRLAVAGEHGQGVTVDDVL